MVLTPDLIGPEQSIETTATPKGGKIRYNFDELVHRFAKIDL